MKAARIAIAVAFALGMAAHAQAGYIEVAVGGTTGPWNWTSGGINSGFAYGPAAQDFTAPTRVKLSDIGTGVGSDLFILYKSGLASNFNGCCGGPWGPSGEDTSSFKDDKLGSTNAPFPSMYITGSWGSALVADFNGNATDNPNGLVADPAQFGVFLMSLVGTLTDDAGNIVGSPFSIGAVSPFANDPSDPSNDSVGRAFGIGLSFNLSAPVYSGATYLNLGINDDTFVDNGGALNVCVGSSDADIRNCMRSASQVPEPGTLGLLAIGSVGVLRLLRRRRKR
jgi:hypothetical protein